MLPLADALTIAFLFLAAIADATFFEELSGQSLIGSHFGLIGFNASFDYVVIGGGTAGLAIATRIAESGKFSVAVIEAGGFPETDNGNLTSIPGNAAYYVGSDPGQRNPLIDWETYTQPQAVSGNVLFPSQNPLG